MTRVCAAQPNGREESLPGGVMLPPTCLSLRGGLERLFGENDLSIEEGEQDPGLTDLVRAAAFGERHDTSIDDDEVCELADLERPESFRLAHRARAVDRVGGQARADVESFSGIQNRDVGLTFDVPRDGLLDVKERLGAVHARGAEGSVSRSGL